MSNLFRVKNGLNLSPVDLATLTSPQAGDLACDINDSNKIKRYDANTLGWTEVGSGGVGNINALLTQTFDTAALAQFTQTGLALSTSNPIDGIQSARLIHQAGVSPTNDQSFKQVIAVDRKYRGELMNLSLQVRSSATSGNLTLLVTDETNAATIMASSSISTSQYQVATAVTNATTTISGFSNVDINTLKVGMTITGSGIPTATVINSINTAANTIVISQAATASATITAKFSALPDRRTFSFTIPTNCASLSYTVTALPEAGLPESYVDDVVIELANVSLLETSVDITTPVVTEWQDFAMTIGATVTAPTKGATSVNKAQWRRVGSDMEIRYDFKQTSAGTAGSGIYLFPIPSAYTIDNAKAPSGSADQAVAGIVKISSTTDSSGVTTAPGQVLISKAFPNRLYLNYIQASIETTANVGSAAYPLSGALVGYSFTAKVPIVGWEATETTTKTIPLTQSGLVQEADNEVRMSGATASANAVFSGFTVTSSKGSDLLASSSSVTVLKSGVYSITGFASALTANATTVRIRINGVDQVLGSTTGASTYLSSASCSLFLNTNDVITLFSGGSGGANGASLIVTKEGSLKQVTVNTNSRITIPTSELRFEGASTRGSTATAIVRFDTQAKIRGDAFTVESDSVFGTRITMTKAGKLDVNANVRQSSAATYFAISKNQATLTSIATTASEVLSFCTTDAGTSYENMSYSGFVNVGDIIRVCAGANPTSDSSQSLNLSFQEQEIQVSVSNTLPQFSESDTSLRLSGANGYGSSATTTRRFASTLQNIGTDVQYVDSPTLGGQFTALSSGIYNTTFYENSSSNTANSAIAINVNGVSVAGDGQVYNTASTAGKRSGCSWQGYLTQGDIVTCIVNSAAENNGAESLFTISKVGKPNVTGVNVTPFVNVPQPLFESATVTGYAGASSNRVLFANTLNNSSSKLFTLDTSGGFTRFVALQNIKVSASANSGNTAATFIGIRHMTPTGTIKIVSYQSNTTEKNSAYVGELQVGEYLEVAQQAALLNSATETHFSIVASANSDQILTAPETFSTDTAALVFAGSAQYTLATLNTAPVGTFITFTYAINTNTRTQTLLANPPAQTTADMNANGMLIYTRAYNAASTSGNPSAIAIQIGKGLKGKSLDLYKSAGKVTSGTIDYYALTATAERGLSFKDYDEKTGILYVDAGFSGTSSAGTSRDLLFSDISSQTSGYLVINASKNPALTGMNLNRVAARAVQTSAQSIPNFTTTTLIWDSAKTFDTHGALNTATGVYTAPETGYYCVNAGILYASVTWTSGLSLDLNISKNGTQIKANRFGTPAGTTNYGTNVVDTLFLAKGDTVTISAFHNQGGSVPLLNSAVWNTFSIAKVSI